MLCTNARNWPAQSSVVLDLMSCGSYRIFSDELLGYSSQSSAKLEISKITKPGNATANRKSRLHD